MNDNDDTFRTGAQLLAEWGCKTREQKLERACLALMEQLGSLHWVHAGQDLADCLEFEEVSCSCADAYRMGHEAVNTGYVVRKGPTREQMDAMRINPNPRIVALLDFAIEQVINYLGRKPEYAEWLGWADSWKAGQRSPRSCVDVAHFCFGHKGWGMDGNGTDPVWHTLGQLAWGGKEACYSHPTGGWLVIRYIADAMTAFGIAFPDDGIALLGPPTI